MKTQKRRKRKTSHPVARDSFQAIEQIAEVWPAWRKTVLRSLEDGPRELLFQVLVNMAQNTPRGRLDGRNIGDCQDLFDFSLPLREWPHFDEWHEVLEERGFLVYKDDKWTCPQMVRGEI